MIVNARFLTQELTGVQRFAIELCKRLKKDSNYDVEFVTPKNIVQKSLAKEIDSKTVGFLTGHLWEQIELPFYLKTKKNPLLINLGSTAPMFYKNQIVTHHDITYIRFPESFSKKFRTLYRIIVPNILKNSKKIITVSEFSKNEIAEYYNIPKNKFQIIYNGVEKNHFVPEFSKKNNPKYILAVSSRNYHKNFQGLVKSFKSIKDKLKDVDLYIVGSSDIKSFNTIELDIEDLKKEERIHFLGRLSDEELIKTYQNAYVFVFPSFYEGFGIPPIEAQACGCPVIASNTASMPEVLQDSVVYFDPNNISDMTEKLIYFCRQDSSFRDSFIKKGIKNSERFDWDLSVEVLKITINNLK